MKGKQISDKSTTAKSTTAYFESGCFCLKCGRLIPDGETHVCVHTDSSQEQQAQIAYNPNEASIIQKLDKIIDLLDKIINDEN